MNRKQRKLDWIDITTIVLMLAIGILGWSMRGGA